ncbi:Oidioi.mRNA.OKI2018_I69.XSR.g13452.t1.cds [Oikopleura dioica]|uniref:Oidioi.mRNA.OKI2018_I69.XSR.g13452.t1.cds n=1 Tax=Oikopleura dioica TaxID=34765 RepID=A0ABN7SAL7_OIKDI|nr:Oidioi.mRNA.OKI2018_I69.XSR.g13452.t1.cds [Oikopleura dioica]
MSASQVPWPLIGGLVGVFAVILLIGAFYVAYAAWKKKREGPEVRYCHKTNTKIIPPAPTSEPKIVKGDIEDAAEALLARKKEPGPSQCDECNCCDEGKL